MFQEIKDLITLLWGEKDKNKARDIAINLSNQLLLVMGTPENRLKKLKDIYNAALPISYFNNQKIESWFEKHPYFNGPIALKLYDDKGSAFESSFFHLSDTATKARIAATTLLGNNWEDSEIYELPKYKIGIDFFLNFDSNSLLMVVSKRGNVRVVEFSERLTKTQEEIIRKLSNSKGVLAFEGIDFKIGNQLPREPQKTIHEILWKELQVSEVNKNFYDGISKHFITLSKFLTSSNHLSDKDAQLFSLRLIGRLLFIWFLNKMKLVNEKIDYFNLSTSDSTKYYLDKIKPLFFEVLNKPFDERDFTDKLTPFLNGGLFEIHSNDFSNLKLIFPTDFFQSLYEHFNKFNFTVDESTTEYEQIAIDPEMLGRVFENLLASIVPETSNLANERKNKGAFYTPREVVSFMCKESLKDYLLKGLNDKSLENGIARLVDLNDARFLELKSTGLANLWGVRSKDIVPKIIELLNEMRIFDPACGSGAFPIGMLQIISRTYERLNAIYDSKLMKHVFGSNKSNENLYESKLFIIKNNLYGSDIEPMAIEFTRLRCWLSLIVEEKSNIKPLPNLDFNFVCSNSLVQLKTNLLDFGNNETYEKEITNLRDLYFKTHKQKDKKTLRSKFTELYKIHNKSDWISERSKQLASWNPFDFDKPSTFFDSKIMFNVDKFDIVIGNPPYIQIQYMEKDEKKLYESLAYESFSKTGDIYCLFYELGINILKPNGTLSFITSNKWMKTGYGINLRRYIINNATPLKLIDFAAKPVFDSVTVDVNIIIMSREKKDVPCKVVNIEETNQTLKEFFDRKAILVNFPLNGDPWNINNKLDLLIKNKIENKGIRLGKLQIKINYGLKTSLNAAFVIDEETRFKLIKEDPKSNEIIKPLVRGKDVKRFAFNNSKMYLILTHNGYVNNQGKYVSPVNIEYFPAIKKHLDCFYTKLEKREDKGYTPYNLRDCAYLEDFSKNKIIWAELARTGNSFFLDKLGFYPLAGVFFLINHDTQILNEFLLAVLNNPAILFYHEQVYSKLDVTGWQWKKEPIEKIPVPIPNLDKQNEIVNLVKLLENAKDLEKIHLISKIDILIYKIFDFSKDEVKYIFDKLGVFNKNEIDYVLLHY
jgi:hypothetical protein